LHGIADVDPGSRRAQIPQQGTRAQGRLSGQPEARRRKQRIDGSRVARVATPEGELECGHSSNPEGQTRTELPDQVTTRSRAAKEVDQDV
jgi:hypothetical protein